MPFCILFKKTTAFYNGDVGTIASANPFDSTRETILYLASLASDARGVDPLLDPLRAITSRADTAHTPADIAALQGVQRRLEQYLIREDPIRVFTKEELQQRIREQALTGRFAKLRGRLWTVIAAAFVMYGVAFALPGHANSSVRGQTGGFLALLVLSGGAAWFFIAAYKNIKSEVRAAYTLLCISSILLGLGQIQLPIVAYYNLGDSPLFRYGGVGVPSLIAMICTNAAVRAYGRALRLSGKLTLLATVLATTAVAIGLACLLAPFSHPKSQYLFDFSAAAMSTNLIFVSMTSLLAGKIAAISTAQYAKAMRLLAAAQVTAAIGLVLFLAALFAKGYLFGTTLTLVAIPFIISNVVWLFASYAFKRASEY